ncbi:MAG: metal-dependent hydrolase [Candidatus Micrarchaeia archaeon]
MHTLFGALAAIIIVSYINTSIETSITAGLIVLGSSLLPDVDHKDATARKAYRTIGMVVIAILLFVVAFTVLNIELIYSIIISALLSTLLIKFSEMLIPKHRGIMHTFQFAIVLSSVLFLLLISMGIKDALLYSICCFVGYASHLLIDMLRV